MKRPRIADTLKEMGCEVEVAEFRRILVETKAEHYPEPSIDDLVLTRDEAAAYVNAVKKKVAAPRLTRVFVLRCLIGVRKMRKSRASAPAPAATS